MPSASRSISVSSSEVCSMYVTAFKEIACGRLNHNGRHTRMNFADYFD